MFGKKARKGAKPEEVALGRVVTPMLDMTFQLLFFFVIQFKPPISEGQIEFNLPSSGPAAPNSKEVEPDSLEKPDEYTLTIIAPSGIPVFMQWKTGNSESEVIPLDENQTVAGMLKALEEKLKTITKPAEGKGKSPVIKIESDKHLKYSVLVQIIDTFKKLGFNDVNLLLKKG